MLEELRSIKIAEIEEQIKQINETFTTENKYNWFEKNIFKKKEYKAYVREQKKNKNETLDNLYSKIQQYRRAKTIQQLGYDLESAIIELERHGISPIITKEDVLNPTSYVTMGDVDKKEGIILIHKTHYAPISSKIRTVKDVGVYEHEEYQIAGHKIPMTIARGRDTIHFAANGEVREHMTGADWNKCKYAILVPFVEIPKEQYASVFPNDTYTKGSVELTDNCWILVPKGESATVKQNNPNVKVIEYDGDTSFGYAGKMVGMLGFRPQQIDPGADNGWESVEDQNKFTEFAGREGFRVGIHHGSLEQYQEKFSRSAQIITHIIKYVEMNPEVLNDPQFVEELTETIRDLVIVCCGTPENLSKDMYAHLLSEGYEISQNAIVEIGKLPDEQHRQANYLLAKEIMKMICTNNVQKTQSQGIKK